MIKKSEKIILLLFCCVFLFTYSCSTQEDINHLVNNGKSHYNNGNYKTAYSYFQKAMKQNPKNPESKKWIRKMKKKFDVDNLKDVGTPVLDKGEKVTNKKAKKRKNSKGIRGSISRSSQREIDRLDRRITTLSKRIKHLQETGPEKTGSKSSSKNVTLIIIVIVLAVSVIVICLLFIWYMNVAGKHPSPLEKDEAINRSIEHLDILPQDDYIENYSTVSHENRLVKLEPLRNVLQNPEIDRENLTASLIKIGKSGISNFSLDDIEIMAKGVYYIYEKRMKRGDADRKTRALTNEVGIRMEYDLDKIRKLRLVALLKDVGYLLLPEHIMNNTEPLSKEDRVVMHNHPVHSADIARSMAFPDVIVESIKYHQERYDGSGYPEGIMGDKIPLLARIVGLCDSFASLITDRPFRNKYTANEAMTILSKHSYLFDPQIFSVFSNLIKDEYQYNLEKIMKQVDEEL